ncbi:hypothetical protein NQ315_007454 [Exocentrus adspersus]|uniref:Protein kinase domain-containing protein n=1 Tax=Exocentrus adspersus TaxID=1586481 RepID=A0AAV8VI29_9CUCU|nr:hypothetical protein NQ315_007454 [Exocentrus adspersus]
MAASFLDLLKDRDICNYNETFQNFDELFMSSELKKLLIKNESLKELHLLGRLIQPDGSTRQVAIKAGKKNLDKEMLREANTLARLNHRNVIKLVAFQRIPMRIVTEHMEWGNLSSAVIDNKIPIPDLLKAFHDVASGMEYVAEQKYVHRDLFSKNILVDSNKTCKIGDFGFARYFGYNSKGEFKETVSPVTEYHTSPEARQYQVFSTKTDVWSFGVLVYEMYYASEPVPAKEDLLKFIATSFKWIMNMDTSLPRARLCPIKFHDYLCDKILNLNPERRASFTAIKHKIAELMTGCK